MMQAFNIIKFMNVSKIILWDLCEQSAQSTIEKANIWTQFIIQSLVYKIWRNCIKTQQMMKECIYIFLKEHTVLKLGIICVLHFNFFNWKFFLFKPK